MIALMPILLGIILNSRVEMVETLVISSTTREQADCKLEEKMFLA